MRCIRSTLAPDWRASGWAVLVALIAAGLWWLAESWYAARLIEAEQARLRLQVIAAANAFETAVERDLAVLGALASYVEAVSADDRASARALITGFDEILPRLHASTSPARALTIAPGGVQRFIYPLAGNEGALNHDLLNDQRPVVREAVDRAIATRQMVVSGPYRLVQGGHALITRQPIFQNNVFWGFTAMALDVEALVHVAGVDAIGAVNEVAFRSASGQILAGSADLFGAPDAVIATINLPDGQWTLAVMPRNGWTAFVAAQLSDARIGAGAVVLLLAVLAYLIARRQSWLAREVAQRTADLAQSQAQFRDFTEASSDWYWEQDADLRFIYVSDGDDLNAQQRASHVIGRTRRQAMVQGVSDAQWAAHEADLAAHRPFRDFRFQRVNETGAVHHLSVSGKPVFDETGRFGGYRGTGTDITARVEAEQRAEEARRRLADSIEALTDGFVLWDAADRMVTCNSAFRRLFDDAEWLAPGLAFMEFCRHGMALDRLAEKGEGGNDAWIARRLETHRNPSAPIELHLAGGRCVVIHESRTAAGDTVGLYADTTEIHQARANLNLANERYELAAREAGIWDWDLASNQVHYSTRFVELLGYAAPDFNAVIGDSITPLVHPEDRYRRRQTLDAHLADPSQPYRVELRLLTRDRGYRWFLARGQSLCGADGRPVRMAGLLTDIDERVRMQEALRTAKEEAETASRTKSAFLASVSHELRTPLNAVIGFSEIMTKEMFGPIGIARYGEYAKDIHGSGMHLLAVINDVLDLSKIEAGRMQLREEPFDLAAVVESAVTLVRERARAGGVSVSATDPGFGYVVHGDAVRIKQVLLNLLSNAVKFTPSGGSVRVGCGVADSGELAIAVSDTGIGMTAEEVAVAQLPFRQIDNVYTRKNDGTGLGVPLAKAFVEAHGGRLEIESRQGAGTRVSIILPAVRLITGDAVDLMSVA